MKLFSVVILLAFAIIATNAQHIQSVDMVRRGIPEPSFGNYEKWRTQRKMTRSIRRLNLFDLTDLEVLEYSLLECTHEHIEDCPHHIIGLDEKCPEYHLTDFQRQADNDFEELKQLVVPGTKHKWCAYGHTAKGTFENLLDNHEAKKMYLSRECDILMGDKEFTCLKCLKYVHPEYEPDQAGIPIEEERD